MKEEAITFVCKECGNVFFPDTDKPYAFCPVCGHLVISTKVIYKVDYNGTV